MMILLEESVILYGRVFEIPLILWTVILIMLEIKEQQENFI
jgi:hypothetical protein